jgi:hypothetical protein
MVNAADVTVYHRIHFDDGSHGWQASNGARIELTEQAIAGQALRVNCEKGWSGLELPLNIVGSRDLKIALLMKGQRIESAGINVFDKIAQDNTTAYGYRYLKANNWTPILYYLDQFRYNSRTSGLVSTNTHYASVRFYSSSENRPRRWFALDEFVVYRGEDRQPPERVEGLRAKSTDQGVQLSWLKAEDNVAVQTYVIARSRNGRRFEKVAESHATSFSDSTASRGTYHYRVFAVDFEENYGPWSSSVIVQSTAEPQLLAPTREHQDRLAYAAHVREVHTRGKGKVRRNHVTLFGDSLTGATVYPHCARSAFGTLTVKAFGYPSMTTRFARNKVNEIIQRDNPEFMFILYGTNNRKSENHIPEAMEDLKSVVKACEAHGTVAILGTIPPRGWTPESAPEARFNLQIIRLGRQLNIPTGYIFEAFQAAGDRRRFMGSDGVHWTGEGMALAGEAWGRTIDQIRFALRQ